MKWIVCVNNQGFEASLEIRKLYLLEPDGLAETKQMLRVVDESGESYLYPASLFQAIQVRAPLEQMLLAA